MAKKVVLFYLKKTNTKSIKLQRIFKICKNEFIKLHQIYNFSNPSQLLMDS